MERAVVHCEAGWHTHCPPGSKVSRQLLRPQHIHTQAGQSPALHSTQMYKEPMNRTCARSLSWNVSSFSAASRCQKDASGALLQGWKRSVSHSLVIREDVVTRSELLAGANLIGDFWVFSSSTRTEPDATISEIVTYCTTVYLSNLIVTQSSLIHQELQNVVAMDVAVDNTPRSSFEFL